MEQEKMYGVSIFWTNDSDELLEMLDELGDPGETTGNDGCQIVVSESEMEAIREYAAEHREIVLEESGEISPEDARRAVENWRALR